MKERKDFDIKDLKPLDPMDPNGTLYETEPMENVVYHKNTTPWKPAVRQKTALEMELALKIAQLEQARQQMASPTILNAICQEINYLRNKYSAWQQAGQQQAAQNLYAGALQPSIKKGL